jgi:hypothetical protein
MRAALILASALLLLPAAQAQPLPGPLFELQVEAPTEAHEPGDRAPLAIHLTRICPNAAAVLEQQEVAIAFSAPDGAAVYGPTTAAFAQQVCAGQGRAEQVLPYVVLLPEARSVAGNGSDPEGNETALAFLVHAEPGPAGPLAYGGGEQAAAFVLAVDWPAPAAAAAEPVEQAMPSPAFALVGLALLAVAAIARRRAAK